MDEQHRLSRRQLVGAAAGTAAAAAALGAGPWASKALSKGGPTVGKNALITPRTLGVQQFSIRDATGRLGYTNNPSPTMGFLGGPDFPDDPTDLGPLMPLPGGFVECFEYLASIGYRGFEFFQFSQNVGTLGRQPTIAEIRSYLDNAGLVSFGTHTGGLGTMYSTTDPTQPGRQAQIDIALTLGHTAIGTAGTPSGRVTLGDNPTNPNQIGWREAARRSNEVGEALKAVGMKYYYHPEQAWFQFFNDPDNPDLSGTHLIEWFTANTGSDLVYYEPDILHSYSGRARFPDPVTGPDFDVFGWVMSDPRRAFAYHLKDGNRNPAWPGPPSNNPYVQTFLRTPTFTDAVGIGEGDLGKGYPADTDPTSVGFKRFIEEPKGKYNRFHIVESDSGPGPATGTNADPGRSLRHAKISMKYLFDK